ncbi:CASP-like protein 4D1 [Aristolochia californica]|uniref:CASP-like protein 4D1 n=1 Tax=Aristolochia californica TaxID=171875 RepID=UPI0035E1AE33
MSKTTPSEPSPSKLWPISILLLRLLTFLFLIVSLIVLVTDSVTLTLDLRTVNLHFNDIYAYRYLLSAAVIGCSYTLLQIPFAVYYVSMGKRMGSTEGLLHFDLFTDKLITLLLATGVGAGFGTTGDFKKILDSVVDLLEDYGEFNTAVSLSKLDKFFNMVHVSTGFLLIGCVCMTVLSVISSYALVNRGASS